MKLYVKKNGKAIFYFEWLFDLVGYDYDYYAVRDIIELYHPLCIDLYSTNYFSIYTVMGVHCNFIYDGEQKTSYHVKLNFLMIMIYLL